MMGLAMMREWFNCMMRLLTILLLRGSSLRFIRNIWSEALHITYYFLVLTM